MNYPFRTAILNFIKGLDDGRSLAETVMTIAENYPPQVLCNMNLLGTHDTPRILTALVDDFEGSREELAKRHLSQQSVLHRPGAADAGLLPAIHPAGCAQHLLRRRGGHGRRQGPLQPPDLPWGREDTDLGTTSCGWDGCAGTGRLCGWATFPSSRPGTGKSASAGPFRARSCAFTGTAAATPGKCRPESCCSATI